MFPVPVPRTVAQAGGDKAQYATDLPLQRMLLQVARLQNFHPQVGMLPAVSNNTKRVPVFQGKR